jgi:deazaflavin-dependent oxidoreductase (nitroreductase family)
MPHYQRAGWFTNNVSNRAVAFLTRRGVSVAGSRVLEVPGRKTGEPRRTPVNLLSFEGERYLVAPRGHTQWVRNLRVSGSGRLLVGRRVEPFTATELPDDEKPPLLRAYLKRWKWEVGQFFAGVGPDAPDEELRRIGPDHPVFRLGPPPA